MKVKFIITILSTLFSYHLYSKDYFTLDITNETGSYDYLIDCPQQEVIDMIDNELKIWKEKKFELTIYV